MGLHIVNQHYFRMATFDIIVFVISLIAFFYGMRRGLIMEVTGLVGIIIAIWIATHFSYIVHDWISEHFDFPTGGSLIAFGLTVLLAMVGIHFLANMISRLLSSLPIIGIVNSVGGALLSTIKVLFILSCLIYICDEYDKSNVIIPSSVREGSITYGPVRSMANVIISQVDIPASKQKLMELLEKNPVK